MATLAPLRSSSDNRRVVTGQQFAAALRPWRARLAMQQTLRWVANGVIAGLLLASIFLLLSRIIPWAAALTWAGAGIALCLLCSLGLALYYRPSLASGAYSLDASLGLHDRLSTAWELRDERAALPALQRRDALRQLDRHTPAAAIPLWPGRARMLALALLLVALALLVLLPNPLNAALQQRAAFQAHVSQQVASIEHLRKVIDSQAATPQQIRQQIDTILQQAEAQLQQASNSTQAQQVLAQAQGKLSQLRDPQASAKAQAQAAASQSLQSSSNADLKAAGTALASGNLPALQKALQHLTSSASKMTPAQRSQLAQQIEAAANQSGGDPQLSSALHQLAKAVADGTPDEITDATKAVESAAAQDNASQQTSSSIDQASQGLQQAANSLTASSDTSTADKPVSGGQQPGQGQNPGQSQGQSPGQSPQGANGQGSSGSKPGKNEQIFVPGQQGTGTSNITDNGGSGTVQSGTSVSYSQVIAAYMQMAHDEIDNSNIPPDLKNLVQQYYSTLEGQK